MTEFSSCGAASAQLGRQVGEQARGRHCRHCATPVPFRPCMPSWLLPEMLRPLCRCERRRVGFGGSELAVTASVAYFAMGLLYEVRCCANSMPCLSERLVLSSRLSCWVRLLSGHDCRCCAGCHFSSQATPLPPWFALFCPHLLSCSTHTSSCTPATCLAPRYGRTTPETCKHSRMQHEYACRNSSVRCCGDGAAERNRLVLIGECCSTTPAMPVCSCRRH